MQRPFWHQENVVTYMGRGVASALVSIAALSGPSLPASAQFIERVPAPQLAERPSETLEIVLVGDTGYSPNHAPVRAKGVTRHGQFQTWAQTTDRIAPLIDADINFLNVETIITTRNDLPRDRKGQKGPFSFRTHPNGMRHLVDIGFNLFSLVNNHSMDYGVPGLRDTLRHSEALMQHGLLAAAGTGMNRDEASRPHLIDVKGNRLSFSAIGIATNNLARHRAGKSKPGQIAYRFDDDFKLVVDRLAATKSQYKMLSIHYGLEGRVRTDRRQIRQWRQQAAIENDIDLIIGHHAHVVRGVEVAGNALIFYGLGNFLHHGTANMTRKGICKDFGLLARVYLRKADGGRLVPRAVKIVPVTDTHRRVRPLGAQKARARIHVMNYLGRQLGGTGAQGMTFTPLSDGSGLYCHAGAEFGNDELAKTCQSLTRAPRMPASLAGRIRSSCAR